MTPVGRFIRVVGAARFYRDGSGQGFVWCWWHPLAWVLAPIAFVTQVIFTGLPDTWRYRSDIGFGMKPWFREHPERLEWL